MEGKTIKNATLYLGDCLEVMKQMPKNSVDSIVTDPPYGLKFMGKRWDYDVPTVAVWKEALRVLKPGGYLLSFGGSRTYHRMVLNIEDAGFEIRDQIMWIYGSGFPKSRDISKAIDKEAGIERKVIGENKNKRKAHKKGGKGFDKSIGKESLDSMDITAPTTPEAKQWDGWGTALKPAHEPICVARKPITEKTIAKNVLKHGTGGINIDKSRVGTEGGGTHCNNRDDKGKCLGHKNAGRSAVGETFHATIEPIQCQRGITENKNVYGDYKESYDGKGRQYQNKGRWPANVVHDGSLEVEKAFANSGKSDSGNRHTIKQITPPGHRGIYGKFKGGVTTPAYTDSGTASRFFYTAKASKSERGLGNKHPTVKPIALMRYLVRLVTPPGGLILDNHMGSGSTCIAAWIERFKFIGIDNDKESYDTACSRIQAAKLKRSK